MFKSGFPFVCAFFLLVLDISDYSVDDECLVKLLKGCCLKNLQRPLQAELCFNHVIQRYSQTRRPSSVPTAVPRELLGERDVFSRAASVPLLPGRESRSAFFVL